MHVLRALQIGAYKGLHRPVREFLAEYAGLVVLSDRLELPRSPADNACLFSVLYGAPTILVGDPGDPGLAHITQHAGGSVHLMFCKLL